MAKRPTGSRRPDNNQAEDAFVARIVEFTTWSKKNSQVLILFGVALVVAVVAMVYYANYRGNLQESAAQELEALHQMAAMGDAETARLRLAQYLERFGGTPYAAEARLTLAELHLQGGAPEQAVEVLEAANVSISSPIGPQIAVLQGRAFEDMGRLDEAEAVYLRVAEQAELAFQRERALQDAARLRLDRGDAAGAAELYQRILDAMETTDPDRGAIQLRLAEARTRASVN